MTKRLIQYGGYIISIFLVAWLIQPSIAIVLLKSILKFIIFVGLPLGGLMVINKLIILKLERVWTITSISWLLVSVTTGLWLMKLIDKLFS